MSLTAIPPMHELIEDYGCRTSRLCLICRKHDRYNMLHAVSVSGDLKDSFLVCEWCDVQESARS